MENKKRDFIKGTGGQNDYLVIAENNGVRLGMKALVEDLAGEHFSHLSVIGFRLRSVSADGEKVKPEILTAAWPGIEFMTSDRVRASATVAGPVPRELIGTPLALKAFLEKHNVTTKMAEMVHKLVGDALIWTEAEVATYIAETFEALVTTKQAENEFDESAVKAGANVVDLQAAALSKAVDKSKLN